MSDECTAICVTIMAKLMNDKAIYIQSVYNGHKIRNKTEYFKTLPRDLQKKIIWHMNESIYYKSLQKLILKILNKKINQFFSKYYIFVNGLDITVTNIFTKIIEEEISFPAEYLIQNNEEHFTCYDNLISLINLFIKYRSVIKTNRDIDYLIELYTLCEKIYMCGYFNRTFALKYNTIANIILPLMTKF